MSCENECFTMKGLVYTSDGTDYTELVKKELNLPKEDGKKIVRLNEEKAHAAVQTAGNRGIDRAGCQLPGRGRLLHRSQQPGSVGQRNRFRQYFFQQFGDDYVKLNIKTYVSSERQEVFDPKLHSITIRGWGADYGDPQNYLGQETYGYDNAFDSQDYNYIVDVEETPATKALLDCYKEFTELVEYANTICDDMDARYEAYAKAEAYLIQHGLVIPNYYNVPWCLSKIDVYSKMNAMFGSQNEKMKNWNTNADGYTTEEMKHSGRTRQKIGRGFSERKKRKIFEIFGRENCRKLIVY